ncbi:hypothetical protein PISMIDRAFT_676424 [Pisolithus microcarpus 441]|uniref:Unplaced genomic scaffold scaffold_19, whole genome shotgun sequence n=1 Tax=Pisolithus microcarpus 441 TaxID=765257 RepID=A0A0C9ZVJ6_9AGAM|nr:hypothetical protein PISMIDRAFT_676424 [Pisolithus microcarpus 441]
MRSFVRAVFSVMTGSMNASMQDVSRHDTPLLFYLQGALFVKHEDAGKIGNGVSPPVPHSSLPTFYGAPVECKFTPYIFLLC